LIYFSKKLYICKKLKKMTIEIPDEVLTSTRLTKLTRIEFQQALSARQIPIHYSIEDLDMDLQHLKELNPNY